MTSMPIAASQPAAPVPNAAKTYVALIEGQKIPIPPEIANEDGAIALALTPYYPEAAEAELERDEKDGVITITVTPKAKSKG